MHQAAERFTPAKPKFCAPAAPSVAQPVAAFCSTRQRPSVAAAVEEMLKMKLALNVSLQKEAPLYHTAVRCAAPEINVVSVAPPLLKAAAALEPAATLHVLASNAMGSPSARGESSSTDASSSCCSRCSSIGGGGAARCRGAT